MKHYKGQCYAWDVVNEAFNEDGTFRESVFSTVLGGNEFIELAFETASKLDPKAKLYYNDYNLESPSPKTEAVQKLVKRLQSKKIRIDGVGLQAHLVAESRPTLDEHVAAIKGFADLGVEVALTELDVRLQTPANATNLAQQKEAYKNVSTLTRCRHHLARRRDSMLTNYVSIGRRSLRPSQRLHRCHHLGFL